VCNVRIALLCACLSLATVLWHRQSSRLLAMRAKAENPSTAAKADCETTCIAKRGYALSTGPPSSSGLFLVLIVASFVRMQKNHWIAHLTREPDQAENRRFSFLADRDRSHDGEVHLGASYPNATTVTCTARKLGGLSSDSTQQYSKNKGRQTTADCGPCRAAQSRVA
jgi:hypothetical protein